LRFGGSKCVPSCAVLIWHWSISLGIFDGDDCAVIRATSRSQASNDFDSLVSGLAAALQQAGLARFHLVTLSLGTILGRALVDRHPEQVLSATHVGTIAELTPFPHALMKTGQYVRHVLPYMLVYRL
jgi:pimeloyl-ACP methyl ester carboxylesterase